MSCARFRRRGSSNAPRLSSTRRRTSTSGRNLPFQSPINISAPPINLGKYLTITYNDTDGQVTVTHHDIDVKIPSSDSDSIDVGGQEFELDGFHFHDPSENHVDGKAYSMEEHFVNKSPSGAVTVLGVFLKIGAYNPALQPILDAASADLSSAGTTSTPIHLAGLLPSSLQGWFFQGSFTTSPYRQPANWFVFATPVTLDLRSSGNTSEWPKIGVPAQRPPDPALGRPSSQRVQL